MDDTRFFTELREKMDRIADRLDGGDLFADESEPMDMAEIGDGFGRLNRDWATAMMHRPDPATVATGTCPLDGQSFPCEVLATLTSTYDVP